MNRVFSRRVDSDFEAEQMAKAMLDVGCEVISVVFNGMRRDPQAMADHATFVVFARADRRQQIDEADERFHAWLDSLTPQKLTG